MKTIGLHQHAGQQVLDVLARRARERAAEDVGEQQREHDRHHGHVEQLERHVLDLEHGAPGERRDGGQRPRPAGAVPACASTWWVRSPVGRARRWSWLGLLGLRASAGRPVSARNTSSRLGFPTENSATSTLCLGERGEHVRRLSRVREPRGQLRRLGHRQDAVAQDARHQLLRQSRAGPRWRAARAGRWSRPTP